MGSFSKWPPKEQYETVIQEMDSDSRDLSPKKKAKKSKKISKDRVRGSRK